MLAQSKIDNVSETILRLEGMRRESLLKGDARLKRKLLADDFVEVTVNGAVRTKSDNVADTVEGRVKWTEVSVSDENVRVFGSTALYTAIMKGSGTYRERPFSSTGTRISRMYVSRGKDWQCVYAQNTRIAP
jgi:hypothetical protein